MTKTYNDVRRHKKANFVQKLQKLVIVGHSLSHRQYFRFSPRWPPGPCNVHEPHKTVTYYERPFLKRDVWVKAVFFHLSLKSSDAASGWAVWALTLLQPGGQIMPTTLLLDHPDLKTQRQLCILHVHSELKAPLRPFTLSERKEGKKSFKFLEANLSSNL